MRNSDDGFPYDESRAYIGSKTVPCYYWAPSTCSHIGVIVLENSHVRGASSHRSYVEISNSRNAIVEPVACAWNRRDKSGRQYSHSVSHDPVTQPPLRCADLCLSVS